MTVTYPHPSKTKRKEAQVPPVAPTPRLRADAALGDAHRLLGGAMAQALMAAIWTLVLLNSTWTARLGWPWLLGSLTLTILVFAAMFWSVGQGQRFGAPAFASGQSRKFSLAAKVAIISAVAVFLLAGLIPVWMFLTWDEHTSPEFPTAVIQAALVLGQLFSCVSFVLRAIDALKYARGQILGDDNSTRTSDEVV